jgi:hypothetical protein
MARLKITGPAPIARGTSRPAPTVGVWTAPTSSATRKSLAISLDTLVAQLLKPLRVGQNGAIDADAGWRLHQQFPALTSDLDQELPCDRGAGL